MHRIFTRLAQWFEYRRVCKAFKGHGKVSRVNGSLVIEITEAQ